MKKYLIASLIVTIAIVGAYFFPRNHYQTPVVGAAGDYSSNQAVATCALDMSTTSPLIASTTAVICPSFYNGSSKDRIITTVEYMLSGLGAVNTSVASTTWKLGTSSDIYNLPAAGSMVLNTTIATSTANGAVGGYLYVSSTTPGATATFVNRIWPAGTYLDLLQNSSSTALGTIKVNYFVNN